MGVSYLSISVICTVLSFVGLQFWTQISLQRINSDRLIGENIITSKDASSATELFLGSHTTLALVAIFAFNIFILLILCLKTIFFAELYSSEIRKLVERLINYVIYKKLRRNIEQNYVRDAIMQQYVMGTYQPHLTIFLQFDKVGWPKKDETPSSGSIYCYFLLIQGTFLLLVVPPTLFQAGLWCTWLAVICSLKMFQALARDRLERLNASPSVTPWTYFRVYSTLLFVLSGDLLWTCFCLSIRHRISSSMLLLLFFEPLSIAFETLQAMVVHGFQLLDIQLHHSAGDGGNCQISNLFDISATGSLAEWKGILIRNLGFFLDVMTLLMAIGHYLHIWWLHGMAFHLVDVVLFLNIRALLSAIAKRIRGFINLKRALGTLHGALPDATAEELQAYDDECAICREPMAKAKKLSCNHLFHLACLRSWLDQGLNEMYSCPTCRKPLFVGRAESEVNPRVADVSSDEQLARQISAGLDRPNIPGRALPTADLPNQMQNPLETRDWRGTGIDTSWLGIDGAGPSTGIRSVGLGRVQMMMRHLAAVGETYAQTALEDAAWSLWHMNPSQAGTSNPVIPPAGSVRYPGPAGGLHMRTTSRTADDDLANLLAMAETVREVLPHVPDEIILQDLQRTNSVTVTVNNLLQMS